MYRKRENRMLLPHEFFLPFEGHLNERFAELSSEKEIAT